jgi:hypothetical protein
MYVRAVLALIACAQVVTSPSVDAAQIFEHGSTFMQFLAHATAQRETWVRNAARSVPASAVDRLRTTGKALALLVVAEDWCADSVHTIPYIASLAAAAGVDMRIVDRAAGAALLARHPTRDGRPATPLVIVLRNGRDVGAWVERPAPLQDLFFAMATDPESAKRFAERAAWYEADRGRTTIAEVLAVIEGSARP